VKLVLLALGAIRWFTCTTSHLIYFYLKNKRYNPLELILPTAVFKHQTDVFPGVICHHNPPSPFRSCLRPNGLLSLRYSELVRFVLGVVILFIACGIFITIRYHLELGENGATASIPHLCRLLPPMQPPLFYQLRHSR
jgi:hypothetical protein